MVITIDGPTASGKSSVAGAVARVLGFYHLNSGLLYRSLAYLLVTVRGYSQDDLFLVKQDDILACMDSSLFLYTYQDGVICVRYNGQEITQFLKDSLVDYYVSLISSQALVRTAMVQKQHELALMHDIVTDGRDVGSLVFPMAQHKFYLTASLPVRAERWRKDQRARGHQFFLAEAESRIQDRDMRDETRKISPLIVPAGAVVIDSTELTFDQTVALVLSYIQ